MLLYAGKVILKRASANREDHAKWGHCHTMCLISRSDTKQVDSKYVELKGRRVYKGWQPVDRIPERCYVNGYDFESSDLGARDAGERSSWRKHIFNCCQVA